MSVLNRLFCVLTDHERWSRFSEFGGRGEFQHRWLFGRRIVYLSVCLSCGTLMREGSSDEWVIPDSFADQLVGYAMQENPYR